MRYQAALYSLGRKSSESEEIKMKKLILLPVILLFIFSCTTTKEMIIDRGINDTQETSDYAVKKLGTTLNVDPNTRVEYEMIDEDTTKITITSMEKSLNQVISKAILQEYYILEGGAIPEPAYFKEKNINLFIGLDLINAGLGLGYGYSRHLIYDDNPGFRWFLNISYGAFDLLMTVGTVYGISAGDPEMIITGFLGMALFKGLPLLTIYDLHFHNEMISSGYNFDEDFTFSLNFFVKEF
jgi:hypothetical protein